MPASTDRSAGGPVSTADVLILPAHPAEGALSMNRYRTELSRQIDAGIFGEMTLRFPFPAPASTRRAGRLERAAQKYLLYPQKARSQVRDADVVHVLDHSWAHLLQGVPNRILKIATVHDLAPLRTDDLTPGQRVRFRKIIENLRGSDLILAASAHTASDVMDLLEIPADRIQVLPMGVDVSAFSVPATAHLDAIPEGPRVVSVGSTLLRKNLSILPSIFAAVKQAVPDIVFVRAGEKVSPELRSALVETLDFERFVELGAISDAELAALYQSADALIFPSVYEGFGFPLLEAMAAGCAAISSDATSLREVGGDAALYFSPNDAAQAAAHLVEVCRDQGTRQSLIDAGRKRVLEFSWERHATQLREIYTSAQ
ncbi:MAG TPA: glycosyltransferase family 1 protein [Chthoniobacterales bacterium]